MLWATVPRGDGGETGPVTKPESWSADDDPEPDPSRIGTDDLGLDGLDVQEADDSVAADFQDFLSAPYEDPATDWWWREIEESALAQATEPESPQDEDMYVNPATGLAIFTGSPAGIDADGNASGCASTDDFIHYEVDTPLGDPGWSDDPVNSFGSDEW